MIFLVSISWSGRNPKCDNQRYSELVKMEPADLSEADSGFMAFYGEYCLESQSGKEGIGVPQKSDRGFDVFLVLAALALISLYAISAMHF